MREMANEKPRICRYHPNLLNRLAFDAGEVKSNRGSHERHVAKECEEYTFNVARSEGCSKGMAFHQVDICFDICEPGPMASVSTKNSHNRRRDLYFLHVTRRVKVNLSKFLVSVSCRLMSSDGYFDGEDDFDADALAQIDVIEAALKHSDSSTVHVNDKPRPPTEEISFDDFFNVKKADSKRLEPFIKEANPAAVAGPSRTFSRISSNKVQTTLFGGVAGPQPSSNGRPDMQRIASTPKNTFGQQARKTKKWDQTAFAKSGVRKLSKGKGRADDESELEDEPLEFEQFPAPFVSRT